MKKKLIIIILAIILLFGAIMLLNNYKNNKKLNVGNPYDKNELHQETIDLIGDELYDNIIVPDKLDEKIASGEAVTVYFFSPTCSYCLKTTPIVVPMVEALDIEMYKLNLLEYESKKKHYGIEGTPTIVHYKNGEEVDQLSGYHKDKKVYEQFFNEVVLEK